LSLSSARMLLAILGSISLCSEALSQTPDQHRAILDRLDLSHREPELSKRVIWNQTDLIPMCRKNFRAYSTCDGKTYQLLQWPNNRSDQVYSTDTSFLSHQLANRLSSSTYVGKYSVTYKYCTEDVIRSLSAWQAQNTGINRDDTISLTYLSPASPWFVCFSRDKFRVAHELEKTGQFDQEHYEFWLWINGRVVGDIECDTGFNPYGNSRVFPQCGGSLTFFKRRSDFEIGTVSCGQSGNHNWRIEFDNGQVLGRHKS